MPIGNPPTKPAPDASEADYEKYRQDFDAYVAQKLAEFANTELNLQEGQKAADERMRDLDGREKDLATEKDKQDAREIVIAQQEEDMKKDEQAYTDKMNILRKATG